MLPRLRALLRKFKKSGSTTMTTQQSGDAIAISFRRLSKSYADTPVRTFSKGMTHKLGLAACLLSGRELLVLDEPTSGLDHKARALLKNRLQAAHAAGRTVFFTSHALADVDVLCDRMAVLHQGRIRYVGSPAGLRERHGEPTLERAFLACLEDSMPVAA